MSRDSVQSLIYASEIVSNHTHLANKEMPKTKTLGSKKISQGSIKNNQDLVLRHNVSQEEQKSTKSTVNNNYDSQLSPEKPEDDSNTIEKVIQKGGYLYYITKDSKDKPLDQ